MDKKIKYLKLKRDFYLDALNNCHKTMEDYYYEGAKKYMLLIADLK